MAHPVIKSGPSKLDLMLALFDRSMDRPRPVTFGVELPNQKPHAQFGPIKHEVKVNITSVGIGIEDGSGESWLVEGTTDHNGQHFKAWFRTDNRRGTVTELHI